MKRYLLFGGEDYYPLGGWDDFRDSFDSAEEACDLPLGRNVDWAHVVDTETMSVVYQRTSESDGEYFRVERKS